MQLFFVRHGQTAANLDRKVGVWGHDDPLTTEGREQVVHACEIIQNRIKRPALIIASPLLRTRQTAGILGEHLNLRIETDDRLREAIVGDWHNRPVADINNDLRQLPPEQRPSFRPPQGETWIETGRRVAALVADLAGKQEDLEAVILVSHDAPIRFGVGTLLETDDREWSDTRFPTASVSLLEKSATIWQAVFLGKV